jgi:hypothetical protein
MLFLPSPTLPLWPQELSSGRHNPSTAEHPSTPPHSCLTGQGRPACPFLTSPVDGGYIFPEMRLALSIRTHLAEPSMLIQDERHLGAVHTGRQPLTRAYIEHG